MRQVFSRLYSLALCATLFSSFGLAQVRSGTIVGSVVDSTGAPAVDVEVTVLETQTNSLQNLLTNSAGEFNVPYLAYGNYTVSARKAGFKQVSRTGIALTTNQTVRIDLRLEVGAVETSVTISGTALELQTESSRVTNTVSEEVIRSIPNINTHPLNYATLTQGVTSRQ